MKSNLIISLLIIINCGVNWSEAQQFAYNLDRRLRQYIEEKQLFETYDFSTNYELGEPCVASATQKEGICRPIQDCRRAVEKFLQTNELDDICRFSRRRGNIAVCCVRRNQGQNNFNQQTHPQFGPNAPSYPVGAGEIQQVAVMTTTSTTTTSSSTTTTTTTVPVTVPISPTSNRKSFQKCEEYKKYAKKVIASIAAPPRTARQANLPFTGKFTIATEFPHMTAIGWTAEDGTIEWKCGGTLISVNFVMTAAHCCVNNSPDVVQISDKNLNSPIFFTENTNRIKIQEVINHPDYVVTASYNDISLIRLSKNVVLSSQNRPACLYQNEVIAETKFLISGWGNQEFGGSSSNELLKAEVDRVDQDTCSVKYATDEQIPQGILKSQLCAGDKEGKADSCQGDSGGPLQIKQTNNLYYIVGITSFGKGCASKKTPGVYTRVSYFLDWIEMIVWP